MSELLCNSCEKKKLFNCKPTEKMLRRGTPSKSSLGIFCSKGFRSKRVVPDSIIKPQEKPE